MAVSHNSRHTGTKETYREKDTYPSENLHRWRVYLYNSEHQTKTLLRLNIGLGDLLGWSSHE